MRYVKREVKMSMGTIQYHLNLLEKQGKIVSENQNFHKYYFPVGLFKIEEREILKILNQETAREIIMIILEKRDPTQAEIAKHVGIAASSINWHLKRIEETGIIEHVQEGKFKKYKLRISTQQVISIMKNYHPNLWSKLSNRLAEMFFVMSTENER
jgi:predicted transcriptional regulator